MRRILTFVVALCLCGMLILPGLAGVVQAAEEEVRAAKKIISVVCDDSGSMKENSKWSYANYATQALIAQLNQQDELYITFMSKPGKAVKIDTGDLTGEVEDMGKRGSDASTPYKAIETAYNTVADVASSDSSTQYWLIVTTDGNVENVPTSGGLDGTVQSILNGYKGKKMDNGTTLNVVYLAMDAKYACTGDSGNALHTFTATNPEEISKSLSSISNMISSRMEATPLTRVDDRTVSFKSALPIYSFSVLSHQSSATVTGATAGSDELKIDRNIPLKKDHLFGNAAVVNATDALGRQQVIPAGTYTVTFSEPVDLKNLLIQYEPAIGVKMVITSQGAEVADPATLIPEDTMSIELVPVIPGTDTPIDPADLPAGIRWNLEYIVDDSLKDSAPTNKIPSTVIYDGSNLIRGKLQIPGFSELVFEEKFTVTRIIYGLTVTQEEEIHYPRKNPQRYVDDNPIIFTVTDDGIPMTRAALEAHKVSLQVVDIQVENDHITPESLRGKVNAKIKFRMNADGTFTLVPTTNAMNAMRVKSGRYTVTVTINNATHVTATGVFHLDPSLGDYIGVILWGIPPYLLYWLFAHLKKKKFRRQKVSYIPYTLQSDGTGVKGAYNEKRLSRFSGLNLLNLIFPTLKPYRTRIGACGITLEAGGGGEIWIKGSSIEKSRSIVAYGSSEEDPAENLGDIADGLRDVCRNPESKNAVRTATDIQLHVNRPVYLKTSDNRLWRVMRIN